jgi:predicted GIY-YIG superfamily endonuclease
VKKHVLYRFYGETGKLLYIGLTENPQARFKNHRFTKPWWAEVFRIDIEHFASRDSVVAAERKAIENEWPLYNVHNKGAEPIDVWDLCECDNCDFESECSECDVCSGRLTAENMNDEDLYVLVEYGEPA